MKKYILFNNKYYKGFPKDAYRKIDFIKNKKIVLVEREKESESLPIGSLYAVQESSSYYRLYRKERSTYNNSFLMNSSFTCLSTYYFENSLITMLNLIE
jgi:hypothetical protein